MSNPNENKILYFLVFSAENIVYYSQKTFQTSICSSQKRYTCFKILLNLKYTIFNFVRLLLGVGQNYAPFKFVKPINIIYKGLIGLSCLWMQGMRLIYRKNKGMVYFSSLLPMIWQCTRDQACKC